MTMRSDHTRGICCDRFLGLQRGLPCTHAAERPGRQIALTLPEHVLSIIDGWAAVELQATPEEVLEAIADALCTNEELRQYAAELFEE
jgi:hypothetical protein